MEYDYIIIGAGASGLSFAALMEQHGHKVALLEAHSLPGGCSSYFEREGFIFDAGATTLSGLLPGRPLAELIHRLDLKMKLMPVDPGIVSIFKNKELRRYRDQKAWITELEKVFPDQSHTELWNHLSEVEKKGWNLSTSFKNIPIRSVESLSKFFTLKTFSALLSVPSLFKSVASEFRNFNITDQDYLRVVDEMLFITAQNQSSDTPLLMGAMGLCYPSDTAYAMGGMKAFSNALAQKCSHIFYRNKVSKILPQKNGHDGFLVETNKGMFKTKHLVSTIPIWNHETLFDNPIAKNFFEPKNIAQKDNCWSAFMLYCTIPLDQKREGLYFQIHCDSIPNCETHSFFVSISHPDDKERSINGRQPVTISTHTKTAQWENLEANEYREKKQQTADYILSVLKEKFNLKDGDLQNIITGSPKTFVRYTTRSQGLVGGIPHSLKRNYLDLFFARSPYKNFYMLGDTQFPGQGIAAVILGSMNLADYLNSSK